MTSTMAARAAAVLVIPWAELSTRVLWLLESIPDRALHTGEERGQTQTDLGIYLNKDITQFILIEDLPCLDHPVENEGEYVDGEDDQGGGCEPRGRIEVLQPGPQPEEPAATAQVVGPPGGLNHHLQRHVGHSVRAGHQDGQGEDEGVR